MNARVLVLFVLALAAGFGLGRMTATPEVVPAPAPEPKAIPGERALELAQIRRVTLRLSASTLVNPQMVEAESAIRNRLGEVGIAIVPDDQPYDAVVWTHLDAHHFRAFDAHGVATELHLAVDHKVEVGGEVRVIPHDLWQSDTMRLVQPELIPREVVQTVDELASHLASAIRRAREQRR